MKSSIIKIITCLSLLLLVLSCKTKTVPQNYDDCILQKMPGATSKFAAHEIKKACARKFNIVNEISKYSVGDVIVKVKNDNGYLVGMITNNNELWIVTRVNIEILEKTEKRFSRLQDYILDIRLSPLETKSFRIKRTEQYTSFTGKVTKAWGLKI